MDSRSVTVVGTPSIRTRMLDLPLTVMLLSDAMLTDEAVRRISRTEPFAPEIFESALIVVCSTDDFFASCFAETTAPLSDWTERAVEIHNLLLKETDPTHPMNSNQIMSRIDIGRRKAFGCKAVYSSMTYIKEADNHVKNGRCDNLSG